MCTSKFFIRRLTGSHKTADTTGNKIINSGHKKEFLMKSAGLLTSMMSTLALPNMASAQSLFDSPLEYFGGSDAGVYQSWASKNNQGYTRSAWFPSTSSPSKGVALHWRMEEDRIHMGVAARATGWVGFGFSEAGGMEGSDVVYFERNSPSTAVDAHILEEKIPIVDDCNDYSLVNAVIDDDFIIFETFRALNTTDNQDRSLLPDSHPDSPATLVIAAWGEEENIGYHGPNNRVRGQLRLYENNQDDVGASFEEIMTDQADGSFVLQASDYTISTAETQYIPFCISREDLVAQGVPIDNDSLYLIGFEPIVDPRAVAHVHHFTVFGGSNENLTTCGVEDALDQVYGWAPGEVPLSLPEDVGRPFGDWDSVVSLRMVIHYDNPQGIAGILDSSGVRFHYTTKPRLYELGTATYGDPLLRLEGSPVGSGYSSHVFDCPGSCTERAFNGESINVIRQFIHMHRTGTSAQMRKYDGSILTLLTQARHSNTPSCVTYRRAQRRRHCPRGKCGLLQIRPTGKPSHSTGTIQDLSRRRAASELPVPVRL